MNAGEGTVRREWTRAEEIEACTLRWLGVKDAVAAKRLGRSVKAVRHRLHALGMCRALRNPHGTLPRMVRRYHRRGWTDTRIAETFAVDRGKVSSVRIGLGLPPVITRTESGRRGGVASGQSRRNVVRCWCCDKPGPRGQAPEEWGWVGRPLDTAPHLTEIYCAECFEKWGWPDPYRSVAI